MKEIPVKYLSRDKTRKLVRIFP